MHACVRRSSRHWHAFCGWRKAAERALPFTTEVTAVSPSPGTGQVATATNVDTRGARTHLSTGTSLVPPRRCRGQPPCHLPDTPKLRFAPYLPTSGLLRAVSSFPGISIFSPGRCLGFSSFPCVLDTGTGSRTMGKGDMAMGFVRPDLAYLEM